MAGIRHEASRSYTRTWPAVDLRAFPIHEGFALAIAHGIRVGDHRRGAATETGDRPYEEDGLKSSQSGSSSPTDLGLRVEVGEKGAALGFRVEGEGGAGAPAREDSPTRSFQCGEDGSPMAGCLGEEWESGGGEAIRRF
jgi:hypothetical protein